MPEILQLSPQPAVAVTFHLPFSALKAEIDRSLPELLDLIRAAAGLPAGPPFTRYLAFGPDGLLQVQIGVPVLEPILCSPPAESILLPGGETASAAHFGPLDSIASTHAAMDEWLEAARRQPSGPRWEVYLAGPHSEPDSARWLIRLFQPLHPG